MFENILGLDTSTWQPVVKEWAALVRAHPQHRLGGPQPEACSRWLRRHKKPLHLAGVIVRLPTTRAWLCDPARFADAVLLLVTGGKLKPFPKPKARPPAVLPPPSRGRSGNRPFKAKPSRPRNAAPASATA